MAVRQPFTNNFAREVFLTRVGRSADSIALPAWRLYLIFLAFGVTGCSSLGLGLRFLGGTFGSLGSTPRPIEHRISDPVRPHARLAALWVGHATVLVQMDDKFILTDPVFTRTVGNLSTRLVEPGLLPQHLPNIDAVLISHLHFDHLSLGSLDLIEAKTEALFVPEGGLVYVPHCKSPLVELQTWESYEKGGLRITAAPVEHVGFRYGGDTSWMTKSFTGYVVEYNGQTVYFGGDTAASNWKFSATRRRFPRIDLALLPIAPIHPREFMVHTHVDPGEALQIFEDLGARYMMAIHYDTFFNSLDDVGEAPRRLRSLLPARGLTEDDVAILAQGEQRIFKQRAPSVAETPGERPSD